MYPANHMQAYREFLPATSDAASPSVTMTKGKLAQASRELIDVLDFIASDRCTFKKRFRPRAQENGVASTLSSLIKPFLHALRFGYCIETPKGFQLYNKDVEDSWGIYFQDFATVSSNLPKSSDDIEMKDDTELNSRSSSNDTALFVGGSFVKITEMDDSLSECVAVWENQCDYFCQNDMGDLTEKCHRLYSYEHNGDEILPEVCEHLYACW